MNTPDNDHVLLPERSGMWLAGATALTAALIMWFALQFGGQSAASNEQLATVGVTAADIENAAGNDADDVLAPTPTSSAVTDEPTAASATPAPNPSVTPTSVPPALTPDPRPPADAVSVEEVLQISPVTFQSGVTTVQPFDALPLDAIAAYLIQVPVPVDISGYSDLAGDPDWNLQLSAQRAEAVRDYLITKGVSPALMTATGYGATNPVVALELTEADSKKNRRVEVRFVRDDATEDAS